jgi:hypothetical protein
MTRNFSPLAVSNLQPPASGFQPDPTDVAAVPARIARPTRAEACFQGLLDGLLVLLYMSALMIFISELAGRPLDWWMLSLQGLSFAIFFGGLRMWLIRQGHHGPNHQAKLLRNRWMLFLMTGVVVAAASVAMMILVSSVRGSMFGLAIAGTVMALAGLVGLVRTRGTQFSGRL